MDSPLRVLAVHFPLQTISITQPLVRYIHTIYRRTHDDGIYRTSIASRYKQENCAIAKMSAWCADKSKQTATPPPTITWLSVELHSIQPDVMDVGVERTFSPQNFSTFPWKKVDDLWAMKSEDVGLIACAISFQDFNLRGHDPPTSQADRQTDGQTTCMRSQDCALYYSASRSKSTLKSNLAHV